MTCRALAPALLPLLTAAYEHPPIATELSSTALAPKDPDRNRTLCRALRPCNLHESVALSAAQLWPCATIHAYPTHRPLGRVMRHAWESLILVATLWALGTPPPEALPRVL